MNDRGLVQGQAHHLGHFFNAHRSAEPAFQLRPCMPPLIYQCHHICRYMDRLNVFKQRALDALLYPPGRISAEARPTIRVEIVHGFYESEIALFNQVAQAHLSSSGVPLCNTHHKSKITSHQLLSRPRIVLLDDQLAEKMLLLNRQERCLVDLMQVPFQCRVKNCYGKLLARLKSLSACATRAIKVPSAPPLIGRSILCSGEPIARIGKIRNRVNLGGKFPPSGLTKSCCSSPGDDSAARWISYCGPARVQSHPAITRIHPRRPKNNRGLHFLVQAPY